MCGCNPESGAAKSTQAADAGALTVRVDDMTCGHCAGTITRAIETGLPGVRVTADPATKLVRVSGTTDLAAVRVLITGAGYTPADGAYA